jgi:Protein of unknown function (DUF2905)
VRDHLGNLTRHDQAGYPRRMDLQALGRILAGVGIALVVVGAVLWLAGRLGLGRLPGDVVVRRGSFTFTFPLATSLVLSVVATILLNLWLGRR